MCDFVQSLFCQLKTLLSDYHDYASPRRQIKFDIYLRRVESSREKYLNSLQHLHECQAAADLFAKKSVRKSQPSRNEELKILTRRVKAAHFEFPHKMFLPNGSSAALVTILVLYLCSMSNQLLHLIALRM